jgi:hypothetical protein
MLQSPSWSYQPCSEYATHHQLTEQCEFMQYGIARNTLFGIRRVSYPASSQVLDTIFRGPGTDSRLLYTKLVQKYPVKPYFTCGSSSNTYHCNGDFTINILTERVNTADTCPTRIGKWRVKLSLCFNWAPRHEGVLGKWRYSSTLSWPRYYMEVSGQLQFLAALPTG